MTETILDAFAVAFELHENGFSVSFEIKELNGHLGENGPEDVPYMNGFIKWDSCSQFYFPSESVPLHFDSPRDYERHFELFRQVYGRCFEIMQKDPMEWAARP